MDLGVVDWGRTWSLLKSNRGLGNTQGSVSNRESTGGEVGDN